MKHVGITVISTVDDEYRTTEGFKNYYGIAHLYKETVTEQPNIMRYGRLKPYQVGYYISRKNY